MSARTEDEQKRVAAEIERVRAAARSAPVLERGPDAVLPPARPVPSPTAVDSVAVPPAPAGPIRPDNAAVNRLWSLPLGDPPRGFAGRLFGFLRRALAPLWEAQASFNSRQVQLDNEILAYVDARFEQTHRHYDGVLGHYGQHLTEVDQRHLILQNELVAHVHDLVKRIDIVLAESERGRVSLEASLRDLRARLVSLEERLGAR